MQIIERQVRNQSKRIEGTDIDCIVVHHTGGGTIEGAISWWNSDQSQASSHYLIAKNGVIFGCVPEEAKAWHAGVSAFQGENDVNQFSIGIELHGDGSVYPQTQIEALEELIVDIMTRRKHVTVDRITGHEDVALPKGRKAGDPGPNFPWADLRSAVRARLAEAGL